MERLSQARLLYSALWLSACLILSGCAANDTVDTQSQAQDEFYEGKSILSFVTEQQAKTPEQAIRNGELAQSGGDLDRALFNYIHAYELDSTNTTALIRIGDIHYQRNNFSTSYQAYQRALSIDENSALAHKGTGLILLHRKAYKMARESLITAAELLRQQQEFGAPIVESYIALGIINDILSDHDQALDYYQKADQLMPRNPKLQTNLGYSYYMQERWSEAEAAFNRALNADSQYKPAWKNLGLTYARQGRYGDALTALEQAMSTSEAYNDIGYICMITRRYQTAAFFFRKAIRSNPQYYELAQQNLLRVKRLLAANQIPENQ
ncbi:MAG: tetratricopeptide repeat protein [Amphritea sp.]|nr:tetratricopeptide repeat protein [Amphritea sp.]